MNSNNIRTINDIFTHLNYPINNDVEDFMLVLTNNGFINYIDNESIFYSDKYPQEEFFLFGEIVIEFSNTIKDEKKILFLFEQLTTKYTAPTIEFAKDIYNEFRSMGYSDLVTRCILYGVLYSLCLNSNLKEFNYREYFYWWVIINPLKELQKKQFIDEAYANVSFWEDNDNEIQICYNNLDNYSLKALDTIYARKNNVKFHQCSYCNGFFKETNANNIKFCSKCRNIHNDLKSDAYTNAYRTAYKTMRQRASRCEDKGYDYNDYFTSYVIPFEEDAKSSMNKFRIENNIQGYIEHLNKLKRKYNHKKE